MQLRCTIIVLSLKRARLGCLWAPTSAPSFSPLFHPSLGVMWGLWPSWNHSCPRMLQPSLAPWSHLWCGCINTCTDIATCAAANKEKDEAAFSSCKDTLCWLKVMASAMFPSLGVPVWDNWVSGTSMCWTGFPKCLEKRGHPTNHCFKFTKSIYIYLFLT